MDTIWSRDFELRHYELDHRGRLSFPSLFRLFQEGAGLHAQSLNIDRQRMITEGLTWVLSRFQVRLAPGARLPGWRETATVQTWRTGLERLFALRDYRLLNASGEILALGTSSWAVVDVQRRRIVAIPQFVAETYPLEAARALLAGEMRLPKPARVDVERGFRVGLTQIDQNDHVNNVTYLSWAMDTIPAEVTLKRELCEAEVLYRAESVLGDELRSTAERVSEFPAESAGLVTYLHHIGRIADGRDIAQLKTCWA
jgi:acyl-ACP thioesterase